MTQNSRYEYAVRAQSITKRFDRVTVLHDVEFSLKTGEIHALVGSNGAGKSTLMKIINGVLKPDSGHLEFFGEHIPIHNPVTARKAGMAMVYQDLSLIPTLTVTQNVFLNYLPYKKFKLIDNKKSNEKTIELLDSIGVHTDISPTDVIGDLSLGQRQIVEIVKALALNPKILILDEPTASLATKEIDNIFLVIKALQQSGISIIYISHYLKDIFKICDSITVLRDGRKISQTATARTDLDTTVAQMIGQKKAADGGGHTRRQQKRTTDPPLLAVKELSTAHVKDITLEVYKNEIVGIAGLLGSGRSELFDALMAIDVATHGTISVSGSQKIYRTPKQALRAGIALVPENRRRQGLIADFSLRENMILSTLQAFVTYGVLRNADVSKAVAEKIDKMNIKSQSQLQAAKFLSGGNQQKVVVGKCFMTNSSILLLDDPTFGIDIVAKGEIMHLIHDYARRGNGVVFVSSEYSELLEHCDRIYTLKRGRITNIITEKISEEQLIRSLQ